MAARANNNGGKPSTTKSLKSLNKKTLSVSEASRVLSAHPNSVRHWADIGLLPAHRTGRRGDRRFVPRDVTNFLHAWNGA